MLMKLSGCLSLGNRSSNPRAGKWGIFRSISSFRHGVSWDDWDLGLMRVLLSQIQLCRDYALFGGYFWPTSVGRGHKNILYDWAHISHISILYQSYISHISVIHQSYTSHISVIHQSYTSHISVIYPSFSAMYQ